MKENLKIRVNDDNRQEVIDLLECFGKSFCWDVKTQWSEVAHIFAYLPDKNLEWCINDHYFNSHPNKEITLPELRELARPKEYLNDKFELVVTNQPDDGWILVPDGAEYLTGNFSVKLFWRDDDYHFNDRKEWQKGVNSFTRYSEQEKYVKILWQRENKVETVKGRFLHQEWYEAFGRGEDVDFKTPTIDKWYPFAEEGNFSIFNNPDFKFRLKPQTMQIGSRTINKPISVKPEKDSYYYVPDIVLKDKYYKNTWYDSGDDNRHFNNGICFVSQIDAIAMTDALLELMK